MTAPGFMAGMGVPAKAYLQIEGDSEKLACHFNPETLTISKGVKWCSDSLKGVDAPTLTFETGQSGTYSMTLHFDSTGMARMGVPVTKYTSKLLNAMKINPKNKGANAVGKDGKKKGRPPYVTFHWGNIHSFKAVIESLSIKYTFFSPTGTPLRATVDLTLKQAEPDDKWWKQNPTSGTPNPQELHTVQPGETLDRIAAQHFGDSKRWRAIATANRILDPMRLRPGSVLTIPELTEEDEDA